MSRPPKAPQDRATCALTLRMTLRDARALRAWAKARGKALAPLLVQAGLREASDYDRENVNIRDTLKRIEAKLDLLLGGAS